MQFGMQPVRCALVYFRQLLYITLGGFVSKCICIYFDLHTRGQRFESFIAHHLFLGSKQPYFPYIYYIMECSMECSFSKS